MSEFRHYEPTIFFAGAAAPYGALILGAPAFTMPVGACKVSVSPSTWNPTTENNQFLPGSLYLFMYPPGGAVADIRLYSATNFMTAPLPPIPPGQLPWNWGLTILAVNPGAFAWRAAVTIEIG